MRAIFMAGFDMKPACRLAKFFLCLVILIAFAWAFGALWYDGPGNVFALLNALAISALVVFVKLRRVKLGVFAAWFALVLGWWLTLAPTNEGDWQQGTIRVSPSSSAMAPFPMTNE